MQISAGTGSTFNFAALYQKKIFYIVLLILAGSIVYANSLHVPFILDDHYSISYNGKTGLLDHLIHGSSRRIADFTFAINYRIHGLQVVGYHLTNIAIHISTAIVLFFMVQSVITALRISFVQNESNTGNMTAPERLLPFAVALLFVIHPVQTQAVTYIIQRYTSLATFFYLLSIQLFLRARLELEDNGVSLKLWLRVLSVILTGLLALGSKPIAVTLPFMLIAIEALLFRGRLIDRRFYVLCGLLLSFGAVFLLFKYQGNTLNDFLYDLRHQTAEDNFTSRTTYFLTQTRVVASYLGLLFLPLGQSLVHDPPMYSTVNSIPVAGFLILHAVMVISVWMLVSISGKNLRSDKWLNGVLQRLAALGMIWFYIAMAVESSIFPIRDAMFEHRVYLPSAGFFLTVVSLMALTVQEKWLNLKSIWVVMVVYGLLLGGMTIARNRVWSDPLVLWQDAAGKAPGKWLAQANLAGEYMNRNMPQKALPLLVRAIELNPNLFIQTKVSLGDTLKALNVYGSRFTTGSEYVLSGGPFGSGSLDYRYLSKWEGVISNNMGLAYEYMNEPEKAVRAYKISVTTDPKYDLAWYNMALLARRIGDKWLEGMAVEQLKQLNPELAGNIGSVGR